MKISCVIMAGGKATRMGGVIKPLLKILDKPVILHVIDALKPLCKEILVVYSPYTKQVKDLLNNASDSIKCIEGSGDYIEDLNLALSLVSLPALVVPSDTPFIDSNILEDFASKALKIQEPIVNLIDSKKGLIGITLFKEARGNWSDIMIEGGYKLIDIDTWEDYEEALKHAKNTRRESS